MTSSDDSNADENGRKRRHHQIEHVSQDVVLAAAGDASGREKLTGQQWAALALAAGVFILILGTISLDFALMWSHLPTAPAPPSSQQLTPQAIETYRALSEHYTTMTNAAHDRLIKIYEEVIAASLLPVFTGIIGFIFGRERS